MNIVILDAHTTNPGDLSWDGLGALGNLTVHARTTDTELRERARGAEALLTNKTPLDAGALAGLEKLRYVGLLSTGANVIDLTAAQARGVAVTNVPAYSTDEVAQATFALILELVNHVGYYGRAVRAGRWSNNSDFCFVDEGYRPLALNGRTLGLVGLGAIGQAVARIALALGMQVVATTQSGRTIAGVRSVSLEELLTVADIVSLHCPLTDASSAMINKAALERMKPNALLVNTARGALVDSVALAEALNAGRLAGAGLDVLEEEPPPADHPLLGARNCIITPHIAWAAREARARLIEEATENLRAFLSGVARNRLV